MLLARECEWINPGDGVIIQGDRLDLIRDGLGRDCGQLVEGDVHRVDVELRFSIKIIADIFNFILMDIQPVERPSIFRFERERRLK